MTERKEHQQTGCSRSDYKNDTAGRLSENNDAMPKDDTGSLIETLGKIITGLEDFDNIYISAFFNGLQELIDIADRQK